MAKKKSSRGAPASRRPTQKASDDPAKPVPAKIGKGGETHQIDGDEDLTTNQGVVVSDDQSTLTVGPRGPQLLEDFILREKITHFDHERIPERVVHARGYGAHGTFEAYDSNAALTKAAFLQKGAKTPVFVRFSTVAGSKGSPDTARDVRGFATKFYTSEGVYDLVGNNMPVFFIQDAIKFPDLIHSVKPEPDRDFPQAQSAHDTFWDFVSLSPESMHMLMWAMSDRAIPRSFRMMEGFGIHTFRMINARGKVTLVKFHWRPRLGTFSLVWDEAVKIAGADPDFHRRDLWDAIQSGDFPEWELSVQAFSEREAERFDFDVLDPTKLVPEELVPLRPLGRMVLDRTVDNFFAETEQVAFCPSHVVPGIDFSNDPLLQGRLFSYLDTQLSRLGTPNFHQLPINRSKSPITNLQRDAHMQSEVPSGRVSYEPNSLDPSGPRESPTRGFRSAAVPESGDKMRARPESFADHYTQARMFWKSMTAPEQRHIIGAFAFELGKCESLAIRRRMLGHLNHVARELADGVADELGMRGMAEKIKPVAKPRDVEPSAPLSQYAGAPLTLKGRKIGVLASEGTPQDFLDAARRIADREGATLSIVGLKAGPFSASTGKGGRGEAIIPDHFLAGAPSVLFDAVLVAPGDEAAESLPRKAAAVQWVSDAFHHLKAIGYTEAARPLIEAAGLDAGSDEDGADADDGLVVVTSRDFTDFVRAAKRHRIWEREERM